MFLFPKPYDVVVIGAGHAGIEAALASARLGCPTLLLTISADSVGQMSCNPAIGGLAKGHLVREIDALGGEMAKATDMTGLQFRMLNTKRGPSVWAPRAQCDKKAYQFRLKWICEREPNLDLRQAQVNSILTDGGVACGVETSLGIRYLGKAVIVTTGTFLRGLIHIGFSQQSGGRSGEAASVGLSESLKSLGLELGRLKTGTPPRVLKRSIDFSKTHLQPGDKPVPYFTHWLDDLFHVEQGRQSGTALNGSFKSPYPPGSILEMAEGQLCCHITHTTSRTAEIIRSNIDKSPLYSGVIEGVGPRYCPSIEDKIIKFPEKERQQIFLEPEGIATDEIYLNGFSTSLPFEVQVELVRSIVGCENAEIIRPAYAIEYDFAYPTQLLPSLQAKQCPNLFLAGQINGTSGYEEAAAQGLIAGINAARWIRAEEPVVLRRDQAYIGVLIDDLVTKGTVEPYRMFTSRAEYRLILRQDNADLRLAEIGHGLGLLPERNYRVFESRRKAIEAELTRLRTTRVGSATMEQLLRRPEVTYRSLPSRDDSLSDDVVFQVETEVKYAGYVDRQALEIGKLRSLESKRIPPEFNYSTVPSLGTEAKQKLSSIRPLTVGQASRISGVSPADISIILVWLRKSAAENVTTELPCVSDENR